MKINFQIRRIRDFLPYTTNNEIFTPFCIMLIAYLWIGGNIIWQEQLQSHPNS